jgi:hypothetical protein
MAAPGVPSPFPSHELASAWRAYWVSSTENDDWVLVVAGPRVGAGLFADFTRLVDDHGQVVVRGHRSCGQVLHSDPVVGPDRIQLAERAGRSASC